MVGKAEIPEAKELLQSLLAMEQNESMRLARPTFTLQRWGQTRPPEYESWWSALCRCGQRAGIISKTIGRLEGIDTVQTAIRKESSIGRMRWNPPAGVGKNLGVK